MLWQSFLYHHHNHHRNAFLANDPSYGPLLLSWFDGWEEHSDFHNEETKPQLGRLGAFWESITGPTSSSESVKKTVLDIIRQEFLRWQVQITLLIRIMWVVSTWSRMRAPVLENIPKPHLTLHMFPPLWNGNRLCEGNNTEVRRAYKCLGKITCKSDSTCCTSKTVIRNSSINFGWITRWKCS